MVLPTKSRATYEDLVAIPEHLVAELIDGELHTSPRPAPRHARATIALGTALHGPLRRRSWRHGRWTILFEPEFHLATDVLVPDVAGAA